MTSHSPEPPDLHEPLDPAAERALAWMVQLQSGTATARDWSDYERWKGAAPDHRAAAATVEALWDGVGPALAQARPKRRPRRLPAALGLLLMAGGLAVLAGAFGPPAAYFADARTWAGEHRVMTLADGSQVELDTGTSIDIDFTAAERRIRLIEGQIYVHAAADPGRPFIVEAGDGTASALGTAFDVRKDGASVTVLVDEHVVRVRSPDADGAPSVDVLAGQGVSYAPATGLGPVRQADIAGRTAWRRGQLVFDGQALGQVIAEMERYQPGRIMIVDPALRDLPVTGVFDTTDAGALLDAVAEILPVRLRRWPWLTLIERDPDRPIEPFRSKG